VAGAWTSDSVAFARFNIGGGVDMKGVRRGSSEDARTKSCDRWVGRIVGDTLGVDQSLGGGRRASFIFVGVRGIGSTIYKETGVTRHLGYNISLPR